MMRQLAFFCVICRAWAWERGNGLKVNHSELGGERSMMAQTSTSVAWRSGMACIGFVQPKKPACGCGDLSVACGPAEEKTSGLFDVSESFKLWWEIAYDAL